MRRRIHVLCYQLHSSMILASKACQIIENELSVFEAAAAALMEATKRAGALDIAWSTFDIALTIFLY
jgi:hypothetical protein